MQNIATPSRVKVDQLKIVNVSTEGLFTPLVDKGLDRLTDQKIEHVMCTSSLSAFN